MSIIQIRQLNTIENISCLKQQQIHGGGKAIQDRRPETPFIKYEKGEVNMMPPEETANLPSNLYFFEGVSEKSRYVYNSKTNTSTRIW